MPKDLDIHIVVDSASSHKIKPIRDWFARWPPLARALTPTSASCIDQIERISGLLTDGHIRRGVHRSTAELGTATTAYLDAPQCRSQALLLNQDRRPRLDRAVLP